MAAFASLHTHTPSPLPLIFYIGFILPHRFSHFCFFDSLPYATGAANEQYARWDEHTKH